MPRQRIYTHRRRNTQRKKNSFDLSSKSSDSSSKSSDSSSKSSDSSSKYSSVSNSAVKPILMRILVLLQVTAAIVVTHCCSNNMSPLSSN